MFVREMGMIAFPGLGVWGTSCIWPEGMERRYKNSSSTNRFGGNFGHSDADRGHMSALVQMLISVVQSPLGNRDMTDSGKVRSTCLGRDDRNGSAEFLQKV